MALRLTREARGCKRYGGKIAGALIVVVAIAFGSWYAFGRTSEPFAIGAEFGFVNGLYKGSKVTVLGVPVGQITALEPRGDHVSVTMTIQHGVTLPEDVSAYVFNSSVISDRHLELGPAYTSGPRLSDGATIPQSRTHSPISFDQLMASLGTLTKVLGPGPSAADRSDSAGELLDKAAQSLSGTGDEFNKTVGRLASASGIVSAHSDDIQSLIVSLDQLMHSFKAKQISVDSLLDSMGVLSREWAAADQDVLTPLSDLRTVFDEINGFVSQHGNDVGVVAENLTALSGTLADNRAGLAEFMDLAPLMMQNLSSTIGPDRRGRIRLNVSTTLTQFATLKPLCDRFPMPLCVGAGLTNPISFPISASDPLGIVSAISGGALPPAHDGAPNGGN